MGPLGVVEVDPLADDPFGREAVGQLVQVDRLVFQRPPQPLDEDVVHAAAATVHGDAHAGVFEDAGEVEAGELAALVRVGDFWVSVVGQRRIQSVNTEPGVHGVRQPPRQDMARRPVHDGDQVQEATLNRDVGDIGAPDLIGSIDLNPLEQIRVNPMRRVRRAGSRRLIDGFQAHETHQAPHTMTADANAVPPQLADHLAAAIERILQEQLIDAAHQGQVLRALPLGRVVERRPADRQNLALPAQAQSGMIAPHHGLAFPRLIA